MRFLATPAVLLLIAAAPVTNAAPAHKMVLADMKPLCRSATLSPVMSRSAAPGIHPLGQEPSAQEYYAVLRTVNGCNKPMRVNERIAAPAR